MFKNIRKPLAGLMCACVLVSGAAQFASAAEADAAAEAKGTLSIPVTKIITGRDWTENDKFEFTLEGIGETKGVTLPENTKLEINEKTANHTGSFGEIQFQGEIKDAMFRVSEKDGSAWDIKAASKKDKDGAIAVSYEVGKYDEASKKFTKNAGMPTILSLDMGAQAEGDTSVRTAWVGQISMDGRDFVTNDVFALDIKSDNAEAPLPGDDSMSLALVGKDSAYVVVAPMAYEAAGEYKYIVKQDAEDSEVETEAGKETVTYDKTEYEVTVTIAEGEDGAKTASVSYLNKTTNKAADLLSFRNTYTNTPAEKPGDDDKKELTNEEKQAAIKPLLDAAETATDAAWVTGVKDVLTEKGLMNDDMAKLIEAASAEKATDADRAAVLTALQSMYKEAGGTIEEKPGEDDKKELTNEEKQAVIKPLLDSAEAGINTAWVNGVKDALTENNMMNDNMAALIGAAVSDNASDSDRDAVLESLKAMYKAVGGTIEEKPGNDDKELIATKLALNAQAVLYGRDWTDSDKFAFELAGEDDTTKRAIQNGDIVMPETLSVTVDKNTKDNKISFGEIEFKTESPEAGYVFSVRQTTEDANGVAASTKGYDLVVKVVANDKGELVATATVFGGLFTEDDVTLRFENLYTAKAVNGAIAGQVKMTGRKFLENEKMTFVMESVPAGSEIEAEKTMVDVIPGKDAETGTIEFPTIEFNAVGEYNYKIYQVVPDDSAKLEGVTYDSSVYTLKVTVKDDMKGALEGSFVITDGKGEAVSQIRFENKYADTKKGAATTDNKNNKDTTGKKKTEKVTPATGIESNATLWVVLSCIAVAAIGGGVTLYVMYRKRQEEAEDTCDVEE